MGKRRGRGVGDVPPRVAVQQRFKVERRGQGILNHGELCVRRGATQRIEVACAAFVEVTHQPNEAARLCEVGDVFELDAEVGE